MRLPIFRQPFDMASLHYAVSVLYTTRFLNSLTQQEYEMKKLTVNLALCALFSTSFAAHAALEDLGNGVIEDTDLGIVWLADANYSQTSGYNTNGVMNWSGANTWVSQLDVGGYDWRLPTTSEFVHLFDELGGVTGTNIYTTHTNAPFALFSNIQAATYGNIYYWTSTPTNDVDTHSIFDFKGFDSTGNKNSGYFSMAVASIPEPETYAMLLAGLGLLGFVTRRRQNSSK
jgi:hypothetical protein